MAVEKNPPPYFCPGKKFTFFNLEDFSNLVSRVFVSYKSLVKSFLNVTGTSNANMW